MRLTQKIRNAMKRYYTNRKQQTPEQKWDKAADLKHISECMNECKQIVYCEASAGTFMICWKDGVQTIHNERNYWLEAIVARKEKGHWIKYRDCCGRKIEPELIT